MGNDILNKKILCVIDSLGSGGAQRQLVLLAVGLKKRGYKVEFFTYYRSEYFSDYLRNNDIKIAYFPKGSRFSLSTIIYLGKFIRENNFAVVISFLDTPNVYSEIVKFFSRAALIVSERSVYPYKKISIVRSINSLLHLSADKIVLNSKTHTSWMKENFPFLAHKLTTITNGVDLSMIPVETSLHSLRKLSVGPKKLAAVGRISTEKNIIRLIKSLRLVRDRGHDVSIDWIGRSDNAELYRDSNELIQCLNLGDNWNWLGEVVSVYEILPNYDALVIPSLWEGFPNVIGEAFACSIPVLGSCVSDIQYLISENETGFLFNPESERSIAEAIEKFLLLDDGKVTLMKQAARTYAEENLSIENTISEYENLINSLLCKGYNKCAE